MNLRNVLRAYSLLRQLSDDESALLNILRTLNDSDREQLVASMSDKPAKKTGKKSAGGGGRSKRAAGLSDEARQRLRRQVLTTDDNEDGNRCLHKVGEDSGGPIFCDTLADNNVHHLVTDPDYHEFQPAATSTGKPDAQSAAGGS